MISALCWVKKGAALENPEKVDLSEEEFERIQKEMGVQLMDAKRELEEFNEDQQESSILEDDETEGKSDKNVPESAETANVQGDNQQQDLSIYDLDNYDQDSQDEMDESTMEEPSASMFSKVKGLAYYQNPNEDPYIKFNQDEDEKEELDELRIENTDNLILACKTEDDISHLEVYVYEEDEDNLYVHHDIMLPSFPLCIEWLDFPVGRKLGNTERPFGNYVAIGTFDPQVEIWDLDCVDAMFPEVILGQIPSSNAGIKSTKGKHGPARVAKRPQPERHVDAVMAIAANRKVRNLVATGSADTTVKLWDLNKPQSAVASFSHHKNKVQAVTWNTTETSVLLTGGYDKKACAFDSRAPDAVATWNLTGDVECMKWDTFKTEIFYVSTEDGIVQAFDVRSPKSNALFTLQAHDSAVSALDISSHIPGFMVTGSGDKKVKLWSLNEQPKCLATKDLEAGKVFSATFSSDSPSTLAIAGSRGKVVVWNLEDNPIIRKAFPNHQFSQSSTSSGEKKPKRETVALDSDEEIEEEEEADEIMDGDYSQEEDEDHV